MTPAQIDALAWDRSGGLLPAIVQEAATGEVRMLGWMTREALAATLASGRVTLFSRSRGRLWEKGETSGHVLIVESIAADCDGDALLVRATPRGPTCHRGRTSCFDGDETSAAPTLARLDRTIRERLASADSRSYTARLAAQGTARVAQKVGEEGVETALAAVGGDRERLTSEAADLVYHLLVLLAVADLSFADVAAELERRAGR
jgi:phosphoribosyl-ATP pyrophosphohydrolase/phosphoribosyl-AMP cyclohydrolase